MPQGVFFRIRVVLQDYAVKLTYITFMNKLIQYLKETKAELKEVVFPTTAQTITFTVLVIVISIIVAVTLGGIDIGLRALLAKVVTH